MTFRKRSKGGDLLPAKVAVDERAMKQQKTKNIAYSFLLLFVSLLLSALAGEVFLRLLGHGGAPQMAMGNLYPVDDPILDWRYVPHSTLREGSLEYRFNSAGFRDQERRIEKPPGVKRIVVVGDSVAMGYGVQWESSFSSRIEARLGPEFEVVTVAQGGLNTPQGVHLLSQSGLAYQPDLVVVIFVLNDCDFYTRYEDARRHTAEVDGRIGLLFNLPVNPRFKQVLKSSALIYFVKDRLENLKGKILGIENDDYFSRLWAEEENRRKVSSGFDTLADLQKQHPWDVVIIIWPLIMDYPVYRFGGIHDWVRREAEERGFATIDLLPAFSRQPYRRLQVTSVDHVHPNALGHRIAADQFLEWLGSTYRDGGWTIATGRHTTRPRPRLSRG